MENSDENLYCNKRQKVSDEISEVSKSVAKWTRVDFGYKEESAERQNEKLYSLKCLFREICLHSSFHIALNKLIPVFSLPVALALL